MKSRFGIALVVSGPSGSGKSSICKKLLAQREGIGFSVSCTTRAPRPGEVDGKDYYFLSKEEFQRRLANDEFLEHAEVHGNFYGTLKSEVVKGVQEGRDVLLDIDVQGALQFRKLEASNELLKRCAEYVFVAPPSHGELERRLRGRGTEMEEVVQRRLSNAKGELALWREYDYIIVNDNLDVAVVEMAKLLDSLRLSTARSKETPFDER
jgi:guanylate kinase